MLVHMSGLYMLTISVIFIVYFIVTDEKVNRICVSSAIFYYSEKWIKELY